MKKSFAWYALLLFSIFCSHIRAQENPFMRMVGKEYAQYSEDLYNEILYITISDTTEGRNIVKRVEEVAFKTGTIEWKLIASFANLELFRIKFGLYGDDLFPRDIFIKKAKLLLDETVVHKVLFLELIVRQKIIDFYWNKMKNYELAFEQFRIQEERLQYASSEDIPEMSDYIRRMGEAHYFFKDYAKAILFFNHALEIEDNDRTSYVKQHARNGLGLSYRYGFNNLVRSDSCFLEVLHFAQIHFENDERFIKNWTGIAQGNLGENMLLRRDFDKAIPLFQKSLEVMVDVDDYAFASGPAVNLADIYLKKGDLGLAKQYLDMAIDFNDRKPRDGRQVRIYEVLSNYYAVVGNTKSSIAFMDAMLEEIKLLENRFNAILLLRLEQKEAAMRQRELEQETERRHQMQILLAILSIGFVLILGLLAEVFDLYRKRSAAYRALVRKSQEWAQEKHHVMPDMIDQITMKEIEKKMIEDKLYRNADLSIDLLAKKIGSKRHNVSNAINHCTKKSFNTFVGEYRIKEAIQILSTKRADTFTIESIGMDVGFTNRQNFHRVFKKITGLSPLEFSRNVKAT